MSPCVWQAFFYLSIYLFLCRHMRDRFVFAPMIMIMPRYSNHQFFNQPPCVLSFGSAYLDKAWEGKARQGKFFLKIFFWKLGSTSCKWGRWWVGGFFSHEWVIDIYFFVWRNGCCARWWCFEGGWFILKIWKPKKISLRWLFALFHCFPHPSPDPLFFPNSDQIEYSLQSSWFKCASCLSLIH